MGTTNFVKGWFRAPHQICTYDQIDIKCNVSPSFENWLDWMSRRAVCVFRKSPNHWPQTPARAKQELCFVKVMPHLKNLSELIETKASVLFFFSPYQMWIRFYHQETFMCSSVNRCIWIVWEQKTDLMFRQQENVACLQQMWGCRCCTFPEWCPALKVCFDIKIVVRLTVMILWCRAIKLYLVKLQSRIISC